MAGSGVLQEVHWIDDIQATPFHAVSESRNDAADVGNEIHEHGNRHQAHDDHPKDQAARKSFLRDDHARRFTGELCLNRGVPELLRPRVSLGRRNSPYLELAGSQRCFRGAAPI